MPSLLKRLGFVLALGGVGHMLGVSRLYLAQGIPDINRVMLDAWVAESQLVAGVLFWTAARRTTTSAQYLTTLAGAIVVAMWAVPFIPILLFRAPIYFALMPLWYLVTSVRAVSQARSANLERVDSREALLS